MKKLLLLAVITFSSPVFAQTTITQAQITQQQLLLASDKVAVAQQQATNVKALSALQATLLNDQAGLAVMQAEMQQQNLLNPPTSK